MTDAAASTTQEIQLVFAPRGGLEKPKFGVKEFSAKIDEIKRTGLNTTKYQVLNFGFKMS